MTRGKKAYGRGAASHFHLTDWSRTQHYKDRNPPWIKDHRSFCLEDPRFVPLPEYRKWQFHAIHHIASRTLTGAIPSDPAFIQRQISAQRPVDLEDFARRGLLSRCRKRACLQSASKTLARHKQSAGPEVEGEGEREKEREEEVEGEYVSDTAPSAPLTATPTTHEQTRKPRTTGSRAEETETLRASRKAELAALAALER